MQEEIKQNSEKKNPQKNGKKFLRKNSGKKSYEKIDENGADY